MQPLLNISTRGCVAWQRSSPNSEANMSTLNTPLQLATAFKPKIWGREDLSPIYSAAGETDLPVSKKAEISRGASQAGELIGEVWSTDDTSRFLNGPVA